MLIFGGQKTDPENYLFCYDVNGCKWSYTLFDSFSEEKLINNELALFENELAMAAKDLEKDRKIDL